MTAYIEYKLDNDTTILVETNSPEDNMGTTKVGLMDDMGNIIQSAEQTLGDAFDAVHKSVVIMRSRLQELKADEVEVTFGLKATGDAGNFAIGKVGAEANYSVKLKWKNT
ncbi:MAG: hypothetical protein B6242_07455 [Anaerolineaceae bacterium 4572_78]|nr:MAG: hypothetical protein B6242_07455 [Anaerolineaceae bacterium 4572_78]